MDSESTSESFLWETLHSLCERIPEKFGSILMQLMKSYKRAVGSDFSKAATTLLLFLRLIEEQFNEPYSFEPYHKKIRSPVDYYQFGLNFLRPLIDLTHSQVLGQDVVEQIDKNRVLGKNAILFANHQTEPDPQAISILLNRTHPHLSDQIIYVAGERVISDPLAIPFSMGCDLLCIYSKRYIDHPPELKGEKQLRNKQTMERMSKLLQEGGKIIYVAPGGGRDRRNISGHIEVAAFDPNSIEMFHLMARKAKTPTNFYPLAVATYGLLPPPDTVQKELGESRSTHRSAAHLYFGPSFDMESFTGSDESDRLIRRKKRADALWSQVDQQYKILESLL